MEIAEYQKMDAIEATHWWFVAKRRFVDAVLQRYVGSLVGKRVLDVGCGTGAVMMWLRDHGADVSGVDMSTTALAYCRQKGLTKVHEGELTALPVADASCDMVTALDVLEHVEDDTQGLAGIARVLKSGGLLIATVPAHPSLWSYHDEALHHHRRYRRDELVERVQKQFDIVLCSWIHMMILPLVALVRFFRGQGHGGEKNSDVAATSPLVSAGMGALYALELGLFRFLGRLPWGTSLLIVAKKKA